MGAWGEPPELNLPQAGQMQIAEARDMIFRWLDGQSLAQLMNISKNIRLIGTDAEQRKFQTVVSEIRGEVMIAQGKSKTQEVDWKAIRESVLRAIDNKILKVSDYDKFKTHIAASPDPFLGE